MTGFFEGVGEVVRTVLTKDGWFVQVEHVGGRGAVRSLCSPQNLRKLERPKESEGQ